MTTTYVGKRVNSQLVPVRRSELHIPLPLLIIGWIIKWTALGIWTLVRSPACVFGLALMVLGAVAHHLGGSQFGFVVVVTTYVWLFFALLLVRLNILPARAYVRSRMRRFWVYRHKWPATMEFAELSRSRKNGKQYSPVLGKVRCSLAGDHHKQKLAGVMKSSVDRVEARMLAGQTVDDWGEVSDRLCQTFGAIDCRVSSVPERPHNVALTFLFEDSLSSAVEPCYATNDLAALPVARQEGGDWYKLPLLGNHVLLVGRTGSGKSSGLWSILNQLKSNVADGTAQLWVLDPKGGMELAFGREMFARFEYSDPRAFAAVLEDAVDLMRERQAALMGKVRLHTPTREEPFICIVIDEMAALTAYVTDRDTKTRIAASLAILQSQGRALGISVLAAVQDPRKETLPNRGLFTVRILFGVNEAEDVDMVLGKGAWLRGAKADEIPPSLQGVAFVDIDGVPEPVRVRFAYIDDEYIGAQFRYPKPTPVIDEPVPQIEALAA